VTYTDSGGTSRGTSTTVDLLGRTTSYTDEQGTITRTVYDVAGRVSATHRTLPGGTEAQLTSHTYDDDGRVLTSTEYVSTPSGRTSTTGYDSAGRPITFDRPTTTHPVRTTTTYDPDTGRTSGLTTSRNGVTQWTDGLVYTLGGKISVDWATNVLRSFTYDTAERLITTTENGNIARRYAFDENTNRCDLGTTNVACTSPAYAYNFADQLTASPVGSNYLYDNRGRLDTYTKSGGGTVNIDYDANDHAKRIDDGTTRVDETLAPSGRVLRRVVTSPPGGTVTEDTTFGYANDSDTPAWARPTSGGTYTTYLGGVIFTGTTPKYQIANPHGDIVGTTDQAGTFTATPTTDEYGVATSIPSTRLGWLGDHERFTSHLGLGIIRMGVRLYHPALGRFLQQDPVEGGSCNDYEYVCGDPVGGLDLDGRYHVPPSIAVMAWAKANRWFNSLAYTAWVIASDKWPSPRRSPMPSRSSGRLDPNRRRSPFTPLKSVVFKAVDGVKKVYDRATINMPNSFEDYTNGVNWLATGEECLRVGSELSQPAPPIYGLKHITWIGGCVYGGVTWNTGGNSIHG
jgi:RHS repeat-associated protein